MQCAVGRGEQNHLNYAICAVNLKPFDDAALCEDRQHHLECKGLSLGDHELQCRGMALISHGTALISHVSLQLLMCSALQQSLSLVLMSPSTCVTFGLVSFPSMLVSNHPLLSFAHSKYLHRSLERDSCQSLIYNCTSSPCLLKVLCKWDKEHLSTRRTFRGCYTYTCSSGSCASSSHSSPYSHYCCQSSYQY